MLPVWVILLVQGPGAQPAVAQGYTGNCNAVQGNVEFIRYPLDTIGAWSTEMGEIGSAMTSSPRDYPCMGSVAVRPLSDVRRAGEEDWRESISGDPLMLVVKYQANRPWGATTYGDFDGPACVGSQGDVGAGNCFSVEMFL